MRIQPIVEGDGEVKAVPELLRRLRNEAMVFEIEVNRPIRRRRHELVNEVLLRKAVQLALLQPECGSVLILFDADDDCPKELAAKLQQWAQDEARSMPCAVVIAKREYEAWFLATIESLRGKRGIRLDATSHNNPEYFRGAKELLEQRMSSGCSYSETIDQVALTAQFDLCEAYIRCRSFQSMVKAFGRLIKGMGVSLSDWPPSQWEAMVNATK
jgi:hypothetical protein